jgi:hypothetical protein
VVGTGDLPGLRLRITQLSNMPVCETEPTSIDSGPRTYRALGGSSRLLWLLGNTSSL